jgi:hypothetical protein
LIALGTGHGKTMLIQVIANMLALKFKNKNIIVVCLNDFLAFWGSFIYGSSFVAKQRIRFMSLAVFLSIPVEKMSSSSSMKLSTCSCEASRLSMMCPKMCPLASIYLLTYLSGVKLLA